MSDSYNHIFGQSLNAFSTDFISGGSSGGEGALIGARGSVVGVGTDIGGDYIFANDFFEAVNLV